MALVANRTHVDMSTSSPSPLSSKLRPQPKLPKKKSNGSSLRQHKNAHGKGKRNEEDVNSDYYVHDLKHLHHHSRFLRSKAVEVLSSNPKKLLFLQGNEYLRARDLVTAAAAQYGLSPEEYCEQMREDSYWGGGPEIVALCNYLRRPIHVYELSSSSEDGDGEEDDGIDDGSGHGDMETSDVDVTSRRRFLRPRSGAAQARQLAPPKFRLRRMACFGSPKFDRKEPLHILSADSRFPDIEPGQQLSSGNHFLALFPEGTISSLMEEKAMERRGEGDLKNGGRMHQRKKVKAQDNYGFRKCDNDARRSSNDGIHNHDEDEDEKNEGSADVRGGSSTAFIPSSAWRRRWHRCKPVPYISKRGILNYKCHVHKDAGHDSSNQVQRPSSIRHSYRSKRGHGEIVTSTTTTSRELVWCSDVLKYLRLLSARIGLCLGFNIC